MRRDIKTYVDAIVADNNKYIAQSGMTIAEYIIENADNNDTRYCEFFDEGELEDSGFEPTEEQINEFKIWLKENYDCEIDNGSDE